MTPEEATISPIRAIADIVALVTVQEQHTDNLAVTEHPVEQGAAITDHAYKRPASVTLRVAWSNASAAADGDPNYVNDIYSKLLNLQESRVPFDVFTTRRIYGDMLITALDITTDEETDQALYATVTCQQIIIVETFTTSSAPAQDQKDPEKTQETTNQGSRQLKPAPNINADALPESVTV